MRFFDVVAPDRTRLKDWPSWISTICRFALAGVWLWAGLAKAADPVTAERAVRAYQLAPEVFVKPAAWGLPFMEIGLGALLAFGIATRMIAAISLVLFGLFIAAIGSVWIPGNSGCVRLLWRRGRRVLGNLDHLWAGNRTGCRIRGNGRLADCQAEFPRIRQEITMAKMQAREPQLKRPPTGPNRAARRRGESSRPWWRHPAAIIGLLVILAGYRHPGPIASSRQNVRHGTTPGAWARSGWF